MASNESLSIHELIRTHIVSFGLGNLSYNTLKTKALLVMTVDENQSVIKVHNLDLSRDAAPEYNPTDEAVMKKDLEMPMKLSIRYAMRTTNRVEVDGIVTYQLNGEKCYVIKLDFSVRRSEGNELRHASSSETLTTNEQNDGGRQIVTGQSEEYLNHISGIIKQEPTEQTADHELNLTHDYGNLSKAGHNVQPLASTSNYNDDESVIDPYERWSILENRRTNNRNTLRYCTEDFYNEMGLKVNDQKPLYCYLCNRPYDDIQLLQVHHYEVHNGFTCLVCAKMLSSKNGHKDHVINQHMPRTFECEICHRRFPSRVALRRHSATHIMDL